MQSMNGVNINLFQFEYDLTWMGFFMDSQDRFYARYGGREDEHPESHLNQESLVRVMKQVLELHKEGRVQTSRYEPAVKSTRIPEDIRTMKPMIAKRKESCIHCHDVKVAEFRHLQSQNKFAREMVFTYPAPSAVGIGVDSKVQNRVSFVTSNSPADKAGVRAGDTLQSADGQRLLTHADFSRVLELTPKTSKLPLQFQRGDKKVDVTLDLSGDWKRSPDPSWRESLHVAGPSAGFWGMKLSADERKKLKLPADGMAVRVTYIWGDYTRNAGIKNGDIVVELDGVKRDLTIHQLHGHLHLNRNYGEQITLVVLRSGKRETLTMRFPKEAPKGE
jgi:serine protease Do